MSKISVVDLEVFYSIGVTDEERARPQRLLITVDMECDFESAARSDAIADTINYFDVAQALLTFGDGRSWKLLEKLAAEIADCIMVKFKPAGVTVEIKKFIIPEAKHVSVTLSRS
jgi:dihydroneopterin aldolase